LLLHPDVFEAGVVGIEDRILEEIIVGIVVLKPRKIISSDELMAHCARHLAPFKRPKSIYLANDLPKSANGKILRRPLRELARNLAEDSIAVTDQ
jgi:acyl-coenzyme A synthetase/AMP-(fatty) acid ligase